MAEFINIVKICGLMGKNSDFIVGAKEEGMRPLP